MSKNEILAALKGRNGLAPIEVTQDNLEEIRGIFGERVEPENLVWTIPGTALRGIVYCRNGQRPPLHGAVRWPEGGHAGTAMLIGKDLPCLRDATGLLISLLTGAPVHSVTP